MKTSQLLQMYANEWIKRKLTRNLRHMVKDAKIGKFKHDNVSMLLWLLCIRYKLIFFKTFQLINLKNDVYGD